MRARSAVVALALALVLPASAAAADGTLTKDAPNFGWDGGPGSGYYEPETGMGTYMFGCGAPVPGFYDCQDTLLEVKDRATLKVAIDAAADDTDLDLYLYRSDAAGEYDTEDDWVAAQADEAGDESVTVPDVDPGFYVAHVEFYSAMDESFKGTAELSGFFVEPPPPPPPATVAAPPPPAAQPAQPATPAQPAAKKPSKRAACLKKAKKIKKAKKRKKAIKRCKKLKR